ncbi:uncharacterized protein IL334_001938 [Kwoniella shivajii]|uniref:Myb-like domain-containing protein n=1 Tax=Kwoniella shivajii TaxID=564305 RepID=A0ABZ1CUF5_9TREE|nr:hypothetical protein IL334_001938 [Kwoniella shivajii]
MSNLDNSGSGSTSRRQPSSLPSDGTIAIPSLLCVLAQAVNLWKTRHVDWDGEQWPTPSEMTVNRWQLPPGHIRTDYSDWEPENPFQVVHEKHDTSALESREGYEQDEVDGIIDRMAHRANSGDGTYPIPPFHTSDGHGTGAKAASDTSIMIHSVRDITIENTLLAQNRPLLAETIDVEGCISRTPLLLSPPSHTQPLKSPPPEDPVDALLTQTEEDFKYFHAPDDQEAPAGESPAPDTDVVSEVPESTPSNEPAHIVRRRDEHDDFAHLCSMILEPHPFPELVYGVSQAGNFVLTHFSPTSKSKKSNGEKPSEDMDIDESDSQYQTFSPPTAKVVPLLIDISIPSKHTVHSGDDSCTPISPELRTPTDTQSDRRQQIAPHKLRQGDANTEIADPSFKMLDIASFQLKNTGSTIVEIIQLSSPPPTPTYETGNLRQQLVREKNFIDDDRSSLYQRSEHSGPYARASFAKRTPRSLSPSSNVAVTFPPAFKERNKAPLKSRKGIKTLNDVSCRSRPLIVSPLQSSPLFLKRNLKASLQCNRDTKTSTPSSTTFEAFALCQSPSPKNILSHGLLNRLDRVTMDTCPLQLKYQREDVLPIAVVKNKYGTRSPSRSPSPSSSARSSSGYNPLSKPASPEDASKDDKQQVLDHIAQESCLVNTVILVDSKQSRANGDHNVTLADQEVEVGAGCEEDGEFELISESSPVTTSPLQDDMPAPLFPRSREFEKEEDEDTTFISIAPASVPLEQPAVKQKGKPGRKPKSETQAPSAFSNLQAQQANNRPASKPVKDTRSQPATKRSGTRAAMARSDAVTSAILKRRRAATSVPSITRGRTTFAPKPSGQGYTKQKTTKGGVSSSASNRITCAVPQSVMIPINAKGKRGKAYVEPIRSPSVSEEESEEEYQPVKEKKFSMGEPGPVKPIGRSQTFANVYQPAQRKAAEEATKAWQASLHKRSKRALSPATPGPNPLELGNPPVRPDGERVSKKSRASNPPRRNYTAEEDAFILSIWDITTSNGLSVAAKVVEKMVSAGWEARTHLAMKWRMSELKKHPDLVSRAKGVKACPSIDESELAD